MTRKAHDTPASGQTADGLSRLPLPSTRGIEVKEISQVEFAREWAQAITRAALAQADGRLAETLAANDVGTAATDPARA